MTGLENQLLFNGGVRTDTQNPVSDIISQKFLYTLSMARFQSEDVIHFNYSSGKQTFIISLTFSDINDAKNIITRIGYGGDVWELRVDLLSPPGHEVGEVIMPSLDYVKKK